MHGWAPTHLLTEAPIPYTPEYLQYRLYSKHQDPSSAAAFPVGKYARTFTFEDYEVCGALDSLWKKVI